MKKFCAGHPVYVRQKGVPSMRTVIGCLLVLCMAYPALADPPIPGVYTSTDLAGPMLTGRYSESWTAASGQLQIGNATNKLSWDGAILGTQWWMYCAELTVPPLLITDTVDGNGNGTRVYQSDYTGGLCILAGNGPWGNATEPSYTAPYTGYSEINTYLFSNNVIVSVISTVNLDAQFLGFDDCMSLSISNQEQLGSTDGGPLPPNFPGFINPATCVPTRTLGSWGNSFEFTLVILGSCTVPTEENSWGGIKALYDDE